MRKYERFFVILALFVLPLAAVNRAAQTGASSKILIRAPKPYGSLIARLRALGGQVTHQYRYVNAVAATIPTTGLQGLRDLLGADAVTKDEEIPAPVNIDTLRGRTLTPGPDANQIEADSVQPLSVGELESIAAVTPNSYSLNAAIANVAGLHAAGTTGLGAIVALIDSGIRPGFPHISLDGSVIGCEDFVGDALGCTNSGNNFHGTFVAGMISANVVFTFSPVSTIRNAVLAECPACFLNPPTNTQIPMIGTAPRSSIYALRIFGATGGAPTSRVIAAMDRAIELRKLYDAGQPGGQNIEVANLSLGGSTLFPGRDLFDQAADALLENGIVPVISAGNAGPSSLTVGSPGSSRSAITVGAASLAHNERILRRLQFGPATGSLYRPFLGVQTAYFSSRGPNADGRPDPDVVANGFASFGQGSGASNSILLASGTSVSAPSVSGVAALLAQKFPGATARQIRNAIVASANPDILADGSSVLDRGAGYVDGGAAAALIASGEASDAFPSLPVATKSVRTNVELGTSLRVHDGPVFEHVPDLKPGERHDILVRVAPNTKQVIVTLSSVTAALPPSEQNQLFGDDILFAVHSAKTSAINEGDYKVLTFSLGGTFTIDAPEPGVMRVTVSGDWTNAGTISADVSAVSLVQPLPQFTAQGKIANQQILPMPISMPAGVTKAEFQLSWREDWGNFPTADLDLIVVDPGGATNLSGLTANSPERVVVNKPAAGTWTVMIVGFDIPAESDKYELRVSLDGKVVK